RALAILNDRKLSARAYALSVYPVLMTATPSHRAPILQAIRAAGADAELQTAPHLLDVVISMLVDGAVDDDTRAQAALLLTAPGPRALAIDAIFAAIRRGQTLSAPMLKALALD